VPRFIYFIALSIYIMSTGGYMAMPLFPLLAGNNQLPLAAVGIMTAIYILGQKTLPLITGPFGDRNGYFRTAIVGESIRGLGFIGIGLFQSFPLLLFCSALAGIGGGIASPSLSAMMMAGASLEERPKRSSLRTTALNAGLLTGPIFAGIILIKGNLHSIFIVAGLCYLTGSLSLWIVSIRKLKKMGATEKREGSFSSSKKVLQNKAFIILVINLLIFWYLFSQLFITIPAVANTFTKHIEIFFWTNGLIGILLQYPLGSFMSRWYKPRLLLTIGAFVFALSFIVLGLFQSLMGVLMGVILFSIGECFMLPIFETLVADSASNDKELGAYFGCAAVADGIGRPLGSMTGPILLSLFVVKVWFIFAMIAVLLMVSLVIYLKPRNSFQS
jgi:MFS family permease